MAQLKAEMPIKSFDPILLVVDQIITRELSIICTNVIL